MLHTNPWLALEDSAKHREAKFFESVLGVPEPGLSDEYLKQWAVLNKPELAFFEQDFWTVAAAVYFFGTGDLLRASRTPAARLMRAVMKSAPLQHPAEKQLPLPVQLWIESIRRDEEDDWRFVSRCRPNDWMRWAVQKKLPVHPRCWRAHQNWRASSWGRGVQMAVSTWTAGTSELSLHQFPAEHTWYVPFLLERTAEPLEGTLDVWWEYFWHVPSAELVGAVRNLRAERSSQESDTVEERLRRVRTVGTGLFLKIQQAVRTFAESTTGSSLCGGRYVIDMKQDELIEALMNADPSLAKVGRSSFRHALPALVQGKPSGRPRKL